MRPFAKRSLYNRPFWALPKPALPGRARKGTATALLKMLPVFFLALLLPLISSAEGTGEKKQDRRVISEEEMRNLFRQIIISDLPWNKENIKIKNFSADQTELTVAQGDLEHRVIALTPERFLGRRYLTVIYTVDGREQMKVKMSGDVHRYGTVLCASGRLSRGTTLKKDDIVTKYRDITMLGKDLPHNPEKITGKVTKTSLQPGQIIYNRNLRKKDLVQRGDRITIIAGSGPIRISVPGEVEHNGGARGETVKVKNMMSRRVIHAKVMEEGVVRAGGR